MLESIRFDSSRGRSRSGFSLIELMIVVAILAIIASVLIPRLSHVSQPQWLEKHVGQVFEVGTRRIYIGAVKETMEEQVLCQAGEFGPVWIRFTFSEVAMRWMEEVERAKLRNVICGFILPTDSLMPSFCNDGIVYSAVDFELLSWDGQAYVHQINTSAISDLQEN